MTRLELLDIAGDIRAHLDIERQKRQLTFVEDTHKYGMYDPVKDMIVTDMPSVTTVLKEFYTPFDSHAKSLDMCDGDQEKANKLVEQWESLGTSASSKGSYAHFKLEQYVWNLFDIDKKVRKPDFNLRGNDLIEAQGMVQVGMKQVHKIVDRGFVPLDTEVIMGSTELGYFGQCDNIWIGIHKRKIVFLMTDYKTNKLKNFKAQPYNKPMKAPFQLLLDTDLSKYSIQQPLYAQLFLDMLKGTSYEDIPFLGFRIIKLRGAGEIIKIDSWIYKEIQRMYPIKRLPQ